MSVDIIMPAANYNDEYCIDTIDRTHGRASIRQHEEAKYIGRNGYATQNIMPDGRELHMTQKFSIKSYSDQIFIFHFQLVVNKYYVVDVGYPNTRGYLAPYKGTNIRYHIPDFQRGHIAAMRESRGPEEKFNFNHSLLRSIIDLTFEVWKTKCVLLRDMHVNYKYEHQVSMKRRRFDETFNRTQQQSYNRISSEGDEEGPNTHCKSNDNSYMTTIRDIIEQDIMKFRR
uniref:DDE Tnp4 domain-containing protein n=1 Tax=Lactuca sativa TaxID=4236 RepID=A0A9R1VJE7_LACSA|nr:hypothetical protein LSAT_V11C500283530 [Lactuca sativa]